MKKLEGRVAVITGAAGGIGFGLAEAFAERGMKLVLCDVDAARLAAAGDALRARGVEVLAERVNVREPEQLEALASAACQRFGAVHVLCNNAGVDVHAPSLWELSRADWDLTVGVNLLGVGYGLRAFMPILLEQDEAHVVNTASVAGLMANTEGAGAYAATKHAVVGLSEALQLQLSQRKARVGVSCLCPGPVNTQLFANTASLRVPAVGEGPRFSRLELAYERAFARWLGEAGMAPRQVGEMVCEALLAARFYVLPEGWNPMIEERMHNLLARNTPRFPAAAPELARLIQEEFAKLA